MSKRLSGGGIPLLSALVLATAFSLAVSQAAAQGASVHIETPSTPVATNEGPLTVSVVVEDVTNLGAFEFDLTYDPSVLRFEDVQVGSFLGSSGREVQCLDPRSTESSMRFACVTLGSTPAGPDGSGVLATVSFEPVGAGSSPLHFTGLTLTDPPAQELPAQAQDATVTVVAGTGGGNGFAWVVWGPVIGVVVVGVAAAAGGFALWARRSRRL
jgi:hypothetical protein